MSTQEHVTLVRDLIGLVERRLIDPLEIVLASQTPVIAVRTRLEGDAEMWAAQLLGSDGSVALAVACRLVAALFPGDEFAPPPGWWQSPFGRVVARRVGHPGRDRVSLVEAAAMLGITRQGVHDLLARGKVDRHGDGGVSTASIRARLVGRS